MKRKIQLGLSALLCSMAVSAMAAESTITSWDIRSDAPSVKVIRDAADRFEKANPNIKVKDSHIANDAYKTKLKISFGANEPPDLFISWGGGPLKEYIDAGQVADITPFLDKNPDFKNRFAPASFGPVTFDGKIYGLPAENTAIAVVFYNPEIFAKYNLEVPKTMSDMNNIIDVLTKNHIAPFALANKPKWTGLMIYMVLVDRIGGPDAFKNAVNRTGSFTDSAFVEAAKLLQDMVKAGAFAKGMNGIDYDIGGSRRLLYSGKAAMELMGTWEMSTARAENPEFAKKLDFFMFPAIEGGKGDPSSVAGTLGDNFISISSMCENPEKAFELLTYFVDDKAVADRLALQRIVPVKGLEPEDPFLQKVLGVVAEANNVQLWYDQELPPAMGEVFKDVTQQLFGLSITPEDAARALEDAANVELNK